MDYLKTAAQILTAYPISNPHIAFIRHNENMVFKITDRMKLKSYLLRIHLPATENLRGTQHTYDGLTSEIKLLQKIEKSGCVEVPKPVADNKKQYISEFMDEAHGKCYCTVMEWIEGSPLSLHASDMEQVIYNIGERLSAFHQFSRGFNTEGAFKRPSYGLSRINFILEELKQGIDRGLYTRYHYDIIKEVLTEIKAGLKELDKRKDCWGVIHGDLQPGNIIINHKIPHFIDFGFSGFGYYLFDVGCLCIFLSNPLRKLFIDSYSRHSGFIFDSLRPLEGFMFLVIFQSYVIDIKEDARSRWIIRHAPSICERLCKPYLEGREVFYSQW